MTIKWEEALQLLFKNNARDHKLPTWEMAAGGQVTETYFTGTCPPLNHVSGRFCY